MYTLHCFNSYTSTVFNSINIKKLWKIYTWKVVLLIDYTNLHVKCTQNLLSTKWAKPKLRFWRIFQTGACYMIPLQTRQGSTLTVVWLPRASEMRLRASENGTQLVRSGKCKWFFEMFNSWRAKWLILINSVLEVTANFT
jgi:hypothetical protein